jgi:hypothetical protein
MQDFGGKKNERERVEELDVDGRIILIRILQQQDGVVSIGFNWLWTGTSGGIFLKTAMKLRLAGGQGTSFLRTN